jgi:hypothetical protein
MTTCRVLLLLTVLSIASLVCAAPVQSAGGETRALTAAVDGNGSVSLKNTDGDEVRRAAAGIYAITVRDRSPKHSLRLGGPGGIVWRVTGKRFVGVVRWRLRLSPGKYVWSSDSKPASRRVLLIR